MKILANLTIHIHENVKRIRGDQKIFGRHQRGVMTMDKKPTVLIVNDDPSQLHADSCILAKDGYQIWAASLLKRL